MGMDKMIISPYMGIVRLKELILSKYLIDGVKLMYSKDNFPPNIDREGWDGKFKGKYQTPNVYAYWAEVEFIDGTSEIF